jgi:hypothetical protein
MNMRDLYTVVMAVLLRLPWPVDIGLAAFFYLLFHWMSQAFGAAAAWGDPGGLSSLVALLAAVLAFALPLVLLSGVLGTVMRRLRHRP